MSTSTVEYDEDDVSPSGERRRFGLVTVVLAAVLTLVLGAAGGLAVGRANPPSNRPADDSAEVGFLRDMSVHHAQAVEMGMIAYAKATNPEVRSLGLDIGLTQHGQISIMHTWLRGWGLNPNGDKPPMAWMPDGQNTLQDGLMPGMATQQQLTELRAAEGKQVDIIFLTLMRQHHLGGIHMAQEAVNLSKNDDVTQLAQTMLTAQQYEMTTMAHLLDQVQSAA